MTKNILILCLIISISFIKAEWDKPICLCCDINTCQGLANYIDKSTFDIHSVTIRESEKAFYIGTQTIHENIKNNVFSIISKVDLLGISKGNHLFGADDGKHLFVTYSNPRNKPNSQCENENTDGCTEIFISESEDNGAKWSSPTKISRKNMNDPYNRVAFATIYVKETGRIYIFYKKEGIDSSAIAYITRPANSQLFSEEIIVKTFDMNQLLWFDAAYTFNKITFALHLTWKAIEKTGDVKVFYSRSVDSVVWTDPMVLDNSDHEKTYAFLHSKKGTENLSIIYTPWHNSYSVKHSADSGITWSSRLKLLENYILTKGTYCAGKYFYLAETNTHKNLLYIYDENTYEVTIEEPPFENTPRFIKNT